MSTSADDRSSEALYSGPDFALTRVRRACDGAPALLKTCSSDHPSLRALDQLEHEWTLASTLRAPHALAPLRREYLPRGPALVYPDFPGESLERLSAQPPLDAERFLRLALAIAFAVQELHDEGVIHLDLKPQSVLFNPASCEVRLTNFGIALRGSRAPNTNSTGRAAIEGTLPYMSPEQTGRTNRVPDSRTDLYSMGILFYQLLVGRLPFDGGDDPLEWIHCHLAREPTPPHLRRPGIPKVLSAIILRLLAKSADDRYQTARGVAADLQHCLRRLERVGHIAPFVLGQHDLPARFSFPQRLFGRDREVAVLLAAFEHVAGSGSSEMVVVAGYSGIGKTSLVQELHRPIVRRRGLYASGKFEQYGRGIPYFSLVEAFRTLVQQILADTGERLDAWREQFASALGVNAQLIVDMIPDLEKLLGPQPPVLELPATEAQNRFRLVVQRFLGVFCRHEHPLTLFLDDLQWADGASLQLLQHLVTHSETKHLLLIGAYRDNEVSPAHPLLHTLDAIAKSGGRIERIDLQPLEVEPLDQLVAEALRCPPARALPLARAVHAKTGGNPFFFIQFLLNLQRENAVWLDRTRGAWVWDLARIRDMAVADNVVDFMVGKLRDLAPATQEVLRLAACLGHRAEFEWIARLCAGTASGVARDAEEAVREGLVLRDENSLRFVHDRIQQAACLLVPQAECGELHLNMGRALLAGTRPEVLEQRVFDVAGHFNLAFALLRDPAERIRVAEIDLLAGRKAKASTAYQPALAFFERALALLPPDRWESHYALAYAIVSELAECAYLTGRFDEAARQLEVLRAQARGLVDQAAVHRRTIVLHTTRDEIAEAIDSGLAALRLFGIDLAAHPTREQLVEEYRRVWEALDGRSVESLLDLPEMQSPEMLAVLDLLAVLLPPSVFHDNYLFGLISCVAVNVCLKHGNASASTNAYALFGAALCSLFDNPQLGYRFGKLGFDLAERRNYQVYKAKVCLIFGDLVNFWTQPLRSDLAFLEAGFASAVETGDLTYACYCANHIVTLRIVLGHPLEEVYAESERRLSFARDARYEVVVAEITAMQRFIQNMRGLTDRFSSFDGPGFDQEQHEQRLSGIRSISRCWYYILKMQARYLSGDWAEALEAGRRAEALIWSTISHVQVPEFYFYLALTFAAAHAHPVPAAAPPPPPPPPGRDESFLAGLRRIHSIYRAWAESCPSNYENREALLAAELARIEGGADPAEAERHYARAIASARANGFVQNEALAHERFGEFLLSRGRAAAAAAHLRNARHCYALWGADGKVRHLERQHPELLPREPELGAFTTLAARPEQIDVLAVVRASQAISSESDLKKLTAAILRLALEHAGARAGSLLRVVDHGWAIEARAEVRQGRVTLLSRDESAAALGALPSSLLSYVRRTGRSVLVPDTLAPGPFSVDGASPKAGVRALMCVPIVRQGQLVGMLYLESSEAGLFTPERLAALELLAAQAGISLENARMIADLQQAKTVVENSPTVLFRWRIEEGFPVDFVSRNVSSVLGYDAAEVLALRPGYLAIVHPADRARVDREARAVIASGRDRFQQEYRVATKDGSVRWVEDRTSVTRDDEGSVRGVQGIVTDITERKRSEVERQAALEQLERAIRLRDEFIFVASHELKTPLTPLHLQVEVLKRIVRDPVVAVHPQAKNLAKMLEVADRQIGRLAKLVESLLDVSRIRAGKLTLEREPLELNDVVRGAVEQLRPLGAEARCELPLRPSGVAARGQFDRSRIEQVVWILVTNAIKYGAGKPVEVGLEVSGPRVRLSVRDHGIGIAPDALERIFDPFERAVSIKSFGGLGLGLYIARQIVLAHGGTISVQSQPGEGALFVVELPLADRVERGADPASFAESTRSTQGGRPLEASSPSAPEVSAHDR